MQSKELIKEILLGNNNEEKKYLFSFDVDQDNEKIYKKFNIFVKYFYPRYFEHKSAPFHKVQVLNYIKSYKGKNVIEIAFRGSGKTTMKKLFDVFALLNDKSTYRKYIKILTRDGKNSRQIVTDVYNLIVEVQDVYGDVFEKEGDKKREETMSSFTTAKGQKYVAGTVGQTQRGHIQDAYRPDWVWFEDVEDRESISSLVITEGIISRADEAISGLSFNGNYVLTANHISDAGVVQWFINKGIDLHKVPIVDNKNIPTWERYTPEKIEQLKREAEDWAGEYLCDPHRAGSKFFNLEQIEKDINNSVEPKTISAGIRFWKDYVPHHRYGIGADLSDGVGKDSCAFSLIDYSTGEIISTTDINTMPPDLFTHEVIRVGRQFGNCIIAPEINNTCGGIAISVLKEVSYPNVYRKEITNKLNDKISDVVGWHTNNKSKSEALHSFKKDYEDGLIKIYDKRLLTEMKAFNRTDLRHQSNSVVTRHFDLLMSAVIAWQLKDQAVASNATKDFYANLKRK